MSDEMKLVVNKVRLKNGKELSLRLPKVNDACNIVQYLNEIGGESDNLLFGLGEFHLSVEEEMKMLESIEADDNQMMILGVLEAEIVSVALLRCEQRERIAHNCDFSISVRKSYWNTGVGTAVMEQLINFARNHPTIKTISLGVRASNRNARKLYKKMGFEEVGYHKNFFYIQGEFDDEILMDLYL